MKGLVFVEFINMVEDHHGLEVADDMIVQSHVASGGAYTSVGTYPHSEIVQLVVTLGRISERSVPDILESFGLYAFKKFVLGYPDFFKSNYSALDLLEKIEDHIHVEVKKLYPDAELPVFKTTRHGPNKLEMIYLSDRAMAPFALGLIKGSGIHYSNDLNIQMKDLTSDQNGKEVQFVVTIDE